MVNMIDFKLIATFIAIVPTTPSCSLDQTSYVRFKSDSLDSLPSGCLLFTISVYRNMVTHDILSKYGNSRYLSSNSDILIYIDRNERKVLRQCIRVVVSLLGGKS